MINKLISKTQVRLLEYDGNPSCEYKRGYIDAINDVLDLESIPTVGADNWQQLKETITKIRDKNKYVNDTATEICSFLLNYMGVLENKE